MNETNKENALFEVLPVHEALAIKVLTITKKLVDQAPAKPLKHIDIANAATDLFHNFEFVGFVPERDCWIIRERLWYTNENTQEEMYHDGGLFRLASIDMLMALEATDPAKFDGTDISKKEYGLLKSKHQLFVK